MCLRPTGCCGLRIAEGLAGLSEQTRDDAPSPGPVRGAVEMLSQHPSLLQRRLGGGHVCQRAPGQRSRRSAEITGAPRIGRAIAPSPLC